jgi:bifunctional non-homologous end joining protein LigD
MSERWRADDPHGLDRSFIDRSEAEGGEDVRKLPLSMRKTNLARLLVRPVDGIHLAPFEQGEIGPDLFRHACLMGLEGLVSKHRESLYRAGIKVKNPQHPAFASVLDQFG